MIIFDKKYSKITPASINRVVRLLDAGYYVSLSFYAMVPGVDFDVNASIDDATGMCHCWYTDMASYDPISGDYKDVRFDVPIDSIKPVGSIYFSR